VHAALLERLTRGIVICCRLSLSAAWASRDGGAVDSFGTAGKWSGVW
jgi:hypothetical protein